MVVASSQSWACTSCSTHNWVDRSHCRKCAHKKPYASVVSPHSPKKKSNSSGPVSPLTSTDDPLGNTIAKEDSSGGTATDLKGQLNALTKAHKELSATPAGPHTKSLLEDINKQIETVRLELNRTRPTSARLAGLQGVITRDEKKLAIAQTDLETAKQALKEKQEKADALHAKILQQKEELQQVESEIASAHRSTKDQEDASPLAFIQCFAAQLQSPTNSELPLCKEGTIAMFQEFLNQYAEAKVPTASQATSPRLDEEASMASAGSDSDYTGGEEADHHTLKESSKENTLPGAPETPGFKQVRLRHRKKASTKTVIKPGKHPLLE